MLPTSSMAGKPGEDKFTAGTCREYITQNFEQPDGEACAQSDDSR